MNKTEIGSKIGSIVGIIFRTLGIVGGFIYFITLFTSCTKEPLFEEQCGIVLSVDRINESNGDYQWVVTKDNETFDIRSNVANTWKNKIGTEHCRIISNDK